MFQIGHCFLSRGGLYVATPCPCLDSSLIVVYHNCGQKHGSLHFRATVPMSLIIQPEPITRSTSVLQARGSVSTLLPLYYNFSAPAVLSSTLKTSLYRHFFSAYGNIWTFIIENSYEYLSYENYYEILTFVHFEASWNRRSMEKIFCERLKLEKIDYRP